MEPNLKSTQFKSVCSRGLARANGGVASSVGADGNDDAVQQDFAVIREVFNRRFGPIQNFDASGKVRELQERDDLLKAIYALYEIGRHYSGDGLRPIVRAADIEAVFTILRRLWILHKAQFTELVAFCDYRSAERIHPLEHAADPFQLRHLLTYHSENTVVTVAFDVAALKAACRRDDSVGVRAWFSAFSRNVDQLPKDAAQRLRKVLMELWAEGEGDVVTLAFELAVLDARLFHEVGWENSRAFCALLQRIGGSARASFDAYLTDEDMDEAIEMHRQLGNEAESQHFRALLGRFDTKLLAALHHSVTSHAEHRTRKAASLADQPAVIERRERPKSFWKLFGLRAAAA